MRFIWSTRGRSWGFRFLRTAGYTDPLLPYEDAFGQLGDADEECLRVGDRVALRFADPEGRRDRAGRVIPHEFVLFDELAARVDSVAEGVARVWPLVADEYAQVWDTPTPPAPAAE